MSNGFKFAINFACITLILAGFQNCGRFDAIGGAGSSSGSSSSTSNSLDSQMAEIFSQTLQQTLVTNCASCHGQLSQPLFAVANSMSGYLKIVEFGLVDMTTPASSLIITKLQGGHNGISAAVTTEVASGVQAWVDEVNSDQAPPIVSITSPAKGTSASATLTITASADDLVGVTGVQFLVDGVNAGAEVTTEPFSTTLDTTTLTNAAHTLTARARDATGNTTLSAAVGITVNNLTPDTTAPTVALTAPAASATITGATVALTATAADNIRVAGVTFLVDGVVVGAEDLTAPYSVVYDSTKATNGAHSITARARDTSGNTKLSTAVSVTVSNLANPNATFTFISADILVPRCISCHRAGKADAGVRYDSYAETIKTAKAGNLAGSTLYTECNSGSMPIGGNKLTAVQIKAISDWISAGALNN